MKRLLSISFFVLTSTFGFAQYHHVQVGPNGNTTEDGQYNADPGISANDSKETIAQKMLLVHKTGNWKYYYDTGTLVAEEYYTSSGAKTGTWKSYHPSGALASEINYATGSAVYFHTNGTKAEEGTVNQANQRTGTWKGWHENGKINYTGAWTSTGMKNGVWKYFDTAEQLVGTEQWNNGIMSN